MEHDEKCDENTYSITPLVTPEDLALSDREKAEALADSLESQFQPVSVPSDPVIIAMVAVALRAHSFALASESNLTNPDEVQEAIRGFKLGKAPGPDGIPNRTLKHLPLRAISLLVMLFNDILTSSIFQQNGSTQEYSPS